MGKVVLAKRRYRAEQCETVLKTVREYNKTIPVVQNIDCGHTNPQVLLPFGDKVKVYSRDKKIMLTY